jgi:hypothetical protein
MTNFRAVLFDWRGTLALTLSGPQWIQEGSRRTGRKASDQAAHNAYSTRSRVPRAGLSSWPRT